VSPTAPRKLWHNPTFLKLWAGQTISLLGSQVTLVALPLTAALVLHADAAQLGVLRALQTLPFLLLGLGAGVLTDRFQRRPLLIGADLGRALLLGLIPLAWALGRLDLRQLFVIAPLLGTLRLGFNVAYSPYRAALFPREQIVEGNSTLAASASVAEVAGPGLAGLLVGLATAPIAIIVDAASFLISALSLALIRAPESSPARQADRRVWPEMREGLVLIWHQPILRTTAGTSALLNFFFQAIHAIFVLFVTVGLGLSPALYGVILMASSVGSLLSALLVPALTRYLGPGPTLLIAAGSYALGALIIPLATGAPWQSFSILVAAWGVIGIGNGLGNIVSTSLTQLLVPARLLGRVTATSMTIGWGASPLGAFLGGILGQALGLRPTLLIAALGILGTLLWLLSSPLRGLHEEPEALQE
jgi:MFS family permease